MISELLQSVQYGDVSMEACAFRISTILKTLGITQSELANAVGYQSSSITNMVKARQFPSRDVLLHLYFRYGVDMNFMYVGDVTNLRHDLVEKLMKHFEVSNVEAPVEKVRRSGTA